MLTMKNSSASFGSLRIVAAAVGAALAAAACVAVPPQPWPPQGSTAKELETARSFVDQQIVAARKQPATAKLREDLGEAAEKVHQPTIAKRKTYRPPVISAEVEDVGSIDSANAIVTFDVRSGYPPDYPIVNNSKVLYV